MAVVRDDINKLPISPLGKRYARLKGLAGLKAKQQMWYKLGNQTFNKGRKPGTFASKDAAGRVKHSFKNSRQFAEAVVDKLLSR